MYYQAHEQACKQLGLEFIGAVADTDAAWQALTSRLAPWWAPNQE